MSTKIVILGAGYAGIEAALTLQKKKKAADNLEITLIDKNPYHTLLTELHEVAGNRIHETGVIVPLRDIFKYTDVKLVQDNIGTIDFEGKKLVSESDEYTYDYLIMAAGSDPNYYGISGLKENSFSLWSYTDALKIREQIINSFIVASQEKDIETRKQHLTFVVSGGGFSGVETIGEIGLWVNDLCREYNVSRDEVSLILVEAMPRILNVLKDKAMNKALKYLTDTLKVEVLLSSAVSKADKGIVELATGRVIKSNTLIWTAGVRASCITDEIDIDQGKACRLKVDEFAMTQHENVYAIGDIAAFMTGEKFFLPLWKGQYKQGQGKGKNCSKASWCYGFSRQLFCRI